jgi:hypothetical protein
MEGGGMKKITIGLVLIGFVFLMGFLPQYLKVANLEKEASNVKQDLAACQLRGRLAELRDLAALIYLEANQKNYGLAAGHSTRYFDQVRETMNQPVDPTIKQRLKDILDLRDTITTGLAKGEAEIVAEVQSLLIKTHQSTKG